MHHNALVYIYSSLGNVFHGCGVVVEGGLIVTCLHVWHFASDGTEEAQAIFPYSDRASRTLKLVHAEKDTDLAFLQIQGELPGGIDPLQAARSAPSETGSAYVHGGFLEANGHLRAKNVRGNLDSLCNDEGLRQFTGTNLAAIWVQKGVSGSPVFKDGGEQLAGIVRLSELGVNEGTNHLHEAFVIPGTTIRHQLALLRAQKSPVGASLDRQRLDKILSEIGIQDCPLTEISARLEAFVTQARAQVDQPLAFSHDEGAAIIVRARAKLRELDGDAALILLNEQLNVEETEMRSRLKPLLRERLAVERIMYHHHEAEKTLQRLIGLDSTDAIARWELGDLHLLLGNTDLALAEYLEAEKVCHIRAESDPLNADCERDLSISQDKVGDVLKDQGKADEALGRYTQALEISQKLVRLNPSNTVWQQDLSVSYNKVGNILRSQGKTEEALSKFLRALEILEELTRFDPSNASLRRNLSVSYNKIGEVLRNQGKTEEALSRFLQALEIREELARSDSSNAGWQRDLSTSYNKVGEVLRNQGKIQEALSRFLQALGIREDLARFDPSNMDLQRALSVSYDQIGNVLRSRGEVEDALIRFLQALEIAQKLARSDPSNTEWQRELSVSYERVGHVLRSQNKLAEALDRYQEGLEIAQKLVRFDPSNAHWQRDLSISYDYVGDILKDQGKAEEALTKFLQALEIREKLAPSDPLNADWQQDLARSHAKIRAVRSELAKGTNS